MYETRLTSKAKKELRIISRHHQEAVIQALRDLRENPFLGEPLSMELTGRFSYKVGAYRIVYKINKKDRIVRVLTAGHRSIVYH